MPELDFDAAVRVEAELGEKRNGRKSHYPTASHYTIPLDYTAANPALTYGFKAFLGPTIERVFEIRRLVVYAADPFTTLAAGTVIVFKASAPPQDSNTEPNAWGDLILTSSQIPNTASFGRHELVLQPREQLILGFKGLANGQQVFARLAVWDYDRAQYYSMVGGGRVAVDESNA